MDFEQLAFIEKWRRRAVRGVVVALDGTHGDTLVTLRVGELGEVIDLRARDETHAIRKRRATLGDVLFIAFRYRIDGATPGSGVAAPRTIAKGVEAEGTLTELGELAEVEVAGAKILLEGDVSGFSEGDAIRFRIADDGAAYVIPTR